MNDYALYIALKGFIFILRILPLRLWLFVARGAGRIYYYVAAKRNRRAYGHLKIVFPDASRRELKAIIRRMYIHIAQNFFEALYLPYLTEDYYIKHIHGPDNERVRSSFAGHKGVVLLACHTGSWELSSTSCPVFFKEKAYAMLEKPQARYARLDAFLNKLRADKKTIIIRVDELKKMVLHLSHGGILGVVADHGGQEGVPVPFFGKLAMTPVGGVKLAKKLNCSIYLAFMRRVHGQDHEMTFKPYNLVLTGNDDRDFVVNLTQINKIFEEWLKTYPEEYLWFYKRWKHSPQKNILILSDGKAGHVKQSLSLAQMTEELGYKVLVDVKDVVYKSRWHRVFLGVVSWLGGARAARFWLNFCLAPVSFAKVVRGAYDVVISTGASLSAVNLACAYENNAMPVVVMKPGHLPLKNFKRVFVPAHDAPPQAPNVIVTLGSLNSVAPETMRRDFESLSSARASLGETALSKEKKIGLLIGGDSKNYKLEVDQVEGLCRQLKDFLNRKDALLLLTTSRRTPTGVREVLKKYFEADPRCRLLVDASVDNPVGTVGGIFYLADALIVSGESISMVSEAAASGKRVVVFEPTALKTNNKVKRFLDSLSREHYISLTSGVGVVAALEKALNDASPHAAWEERRHIQEELKKIF